MWCGLDHSLATSLWPDLLLILLNEEWVIRINQGSYVQLRCGMHMYVASAKLPVLAMTTDINTEKPTRPALEVTINNARIDHITLQIIHAEELASSPIKCRVSVSGQEVKSMIQNLYPGCNDSDAIYSDFVDYHMISAKTTIMVPFATENGLSSAERPLSDVLGECNVELRGTFNVVLAIVTDSTRGKDTIKSVAASRITRTTEKMRYMTDETFPYYVLRGYDIPHKDLDEFMDTY